jgi:hypothetical protein
MRIYAADIFAKQASQNSNVSFYTILTSFHYSLILENEVLATKPYHALYHHILNYNLQTYLQSIINIPVFSASPLILP